MGTPFDGVVSSSIAFSDADGDSDQDVIITGSNSSNTSISRRLLYRSSGFFTELFGTPFDGVVYCSIAFADVDGDSDQDVLITGLTGSVRIAKLYSNNGSGTFTEVTGTPFDEIASSSIAFADVDGDSDQDALITGRTSLGLSISKLYNNNGSGIFTEMLSTPFDGVENSSIAFAEIDEDSDHDMINTGK